jgi:hypothetical protein
MNERIKELMGKTLDDKFSHTWDTMTYEGLLMFSEKFAQLIVSECIYEVEGLQVLQSTLDRSQHWNRAIAHTALHLKEHFGVKE